jgi:hypothetical protein
MKLTAESKFRAALLVAVFCVTNLFASFEPLPMGGRAAGMGEAYSAIADDVYSLYYNPAGVLQVSRPEIGSYYSRLFMGLSDDSEISRTFFGYAQPFGKGGRLGGIGASYFALDLPGLYKEEGFGITYGREVKKLWNLGGSIKMLKKQIGSDEFTTNAVNPITGNPTNSPDPLLASGRSKTAIALDFGAQYRLTRAYALGFAARNFNGPDLALEGSSDKAPSIYTAALARKLRKGSLDVELMNWKGAESNSRLSLGGEHWFDNGFALRAGLGMGSRSYSTLSFGASYRMESFQFDYATVLPLSGVEGTIGNQQISLTVRLGKPPVDPLEQQLIQEKEERIKAETEARYAKAESDRLKKQLYSLTEEKSRAQKDREEKSAQRALDEALDQKQKSERAATTTRNEPNRTAFNEYTAALAEYNNRVRSGISLDQKKEILEKILSKFQNSGIDTSTVTRELKSLQVEESRAKKDFELSMNFYRRLVQQGASVEDRRGMLKRIIEKYKGTGIDVKSAEDEMATLK